MKDAIDNGLTRSVVKPARHRTRNCLTAFSALSISLLAACAAGPPEAVSGVGRQQPAAVRGQAFAAAHCSRCHAVESGSSPIAAAPSFEDVANMPALTAETLNPWLRDSHNFPEVMDFDIAPAHVDDLAAYILTLKDPAYRPRIQ